MIAFYTPNTEINDLFSNCTIHKTFKLVFILEPLLLPNNALHFYSIVKL